MADDNTKAAAKLRKLGERVRQGWHQVHPLSQKHLAAVRTAVRQQWEQEHAGKSLAQEEAAVRPTRAAQEKPARQASKTARQESSRSQGHDHGHSH